MKPLAVASWVVVFVVAAAAYLSLTIFVVQPIGAVPDGVTLVIWRRQGTRFLDSADAFCQRNTGQVTLLCRAAALAGIAQGDILLRLPYSRSLYLLTTGGSEYTR